MINKLESENNVSARPFWKTFVKQSFRKETGDGAIIFAKNGSIFRLESILGVGGLSVIYKAKRFSDGSVLAIKLANSKKDIKTNEFIHHEISILRALNHPNIIKVIESGETVADEPYIALELLKGQTLEQLLLAHKIIPLERALNICQSVANALDYAHQNGVLHRDIKPSNIMIETIAGQDSVTIFDFGIATNTEKISAEDLNSSAGSLLYACPEQLEFGEYTKQSEIYQLALVLFEMLTGRLPFESSLKGAIAYRKGGPLLLANNELAGNYLGQNVRSLLEYALSRNPSKRPCSMNLFAHELHQIQFKNRIQEIKSTNMTKEAVIA
jgi:serine/threonine-protein kinase